MRGQDHYPEVAFDCEVHWLREIQVETGELPLPPALRHLLQKKGIFLELIEESDGTTSLRPSRCPRILG